MANLGFYLTISRINYDTGHHDNAVRTFLNQIRQSQKSQPNSRLHSRVAAHVEGHEELFSACKFSLSMASSSVLLLCTLPRVGINFFGIPTQAADQQLSTQESFRL